MLSNAIRPGAGPRYATWVSGPRQQWLQSVQRYGGFRGWLLEGLELRGGRCEVEVVFTTLWKLGLVQWYFPYVEKGIFYGFSDYLLLFVYCLFPSFKCVCDVHVGNRDSDDHAWHGGCRGLSCRHGWQELPTGPPLALWSGFATQCASRVGTEKDHCGGLEHLEPNIPPGLVLKMFFFLEQEDTVVVKIMYAACGL